MTDYFVASGGSNTSPYDTWAKAATSFGTALAAASTDGDRVIIQYDGVPSADSSVGVTTSWTTAASISIIASTNSGTNTITPTAMGAANWLGSSSGSYSITLAVNNTAGKTLYCYGLTLRNGGTTICDIVINPNSGHVSLENCYLWNGSDYNLNAIKLGVTTGSSEVAVTLRNCTLRFANTGCSLRPMTGRFQLIGCSISADGSAPSPLITTASDSTGYVLLESCDLAASGTTLVGDMLAGYKRVDFANCKLPASFVAIASQTNTSAGSAEAYLFNCYSGDEHFHIQHHNALGSTVVDTGIYATSNIADLNLSWKIIGSANANARTPYESPWIDVYHTGTSAITPSLECVRSGSSTAYTDAEVWSEWIYQGTSGYPLGTLITDRVALAGTPANQTTGTLGASDWTGENATSWFGKLGPASSFTPAEVGHIRARVCVAGAHTVYVDPQIRGLA